MNVQFGWTPLIEAAYKGSSDVVIELLSHGADKTPLTTTRHPLCTTEPGLTAAAVARSKGFHEVAGML